MFFASIVAASNDCHKLFGRRFEYGACRIEQLLKQRGFSISHRQIGKLLLRNGLVKPNVKKQKSRKFVRYEMGNPNDMWHTDWSYDPFTGQQLSVYLDDGTRLVTSFGLFSNGNVFMLASPRFCINPC